MKAGWEVKTLGEVCDFQRGLTYTKSDEVEISNNVVLRATNVNLATNLLDFTELKYISDKVIVPESKKIKTGSLIICTASGSKSHLGKVAYIDEDYGYAFGGFMGMITPKQNLNSSFLFHLMTSSAYKDFIAAVSDGANINNLKFDDLKKFTIPLPSLPEQQRIVAILDAAFASIATAKANTEQNLKNARALFDSYLQDTFTKCTETYGHKTVGEISKHSLGKMLDKAKNRGEFKPYFRYIYVRLFNLDLSDTLEMKFLPEETEKYTAVKGDVLICEGGYPGRAAIWENDEPIFFQKALHRVRFHEAEHNKWFVYFLYSQDSSGSLRQYFTGSGIQHFTGSVLKQFKIPIPPIQETKLHIVKFDALQKETQRLETLYQRKLTALEELKKALLHQAFNGEL